MNQIGLVLGAFSSVSLIAAFAVYSNTLTDNVNVNDVEVTQSTYAPEVDIALHCEYDAVCNKIAEAIVYESRSESIDGQYAVASVIMNRVDHPRHPNSVSGVINKQAQFSYINDMHKQKAPSKSSWYTAYMAAYDVLYNNVRTTDALFYLNPREVKRMPKWALEFKFITTIDNHDFYTYP